MPDMPSSPIGNLIVHVARQRKDQALEDEVREIVVAVEKLVELHKRVARPQVVGYVMASFAHKLKGMKEWPKEP